MIVVYVLKVIQAIVLMQTKTVMVIVLVKQNLIAVVYVQVVRVIM